MTAQKIESIIGFPVTVQGRDVCVEEIISWIAKGEKKKYFVCANPHSLVLAESDRVFKESILDADLVIPDGSGILLASILLGGSIRRKISGSTIFRELSRKLNTQKNYSYFFLGSTEKVLFEMKKKMAEVYPDIKVVGVYAPPFTPEFSDEETRKIIDVVNRKNPDVLWIGMTAPKQEKWIYRNREYLDVKFIGPVGAVFDFFTGNVERSHPLFIRTGLEWLPRLLRQPRRLWRRTLISAPKFILKVCRQKLKGIRGDAV